MCGKASASKSLSASVPCMDTPLPARIEGFAVETMNYERRTMNRKASRTRSRVQRSWVIVSKEPGGQVREVIQRSPRRRRLVTSIGRAGAGILTEKIFGGSE